MSLTIDLLGVTDNDGTRRDRYGRYLVLPPDGTRPVAYTRATTIAKAIEDQHSLIAWKARATAVGLTRRPELLGMIAVTDDRNRLDQLCEDAATAGGATERRDQGTALHHAFECSLRGEQVPELFRADVDAIHDALKRHGFRPIPGMVEVMVVDDGRKIAGRFDLAIENDAGQYIADLKSGASLDYSGCAFAAQLAIYAGADSLYTQGRAADGSQDARAPLPAVSRDIAYILHAQPGTAQCDIYAVDIAYGAELVELNLTVRAARNRGRKLITPYTSPLAPGVEAVDPPATVAAAPARSGIVDRIETLKQIQHAATQLAAGWPVGVPGLKSAHVHTDGQLAAIEQVVAMVEAARGAPIYPDPYTPEVVARIYVDAPVRVPVVGIDEGGDVPPEVIAALVADMGQLTADELGFLTGVAAVCNAAKYPIGLKSKPSTRRVAIVRALMLWADLDEETFTAGLVEVCGEHVDTIPLGATVGQLSTDQAERLAHLSVALSFGVAGVAYQLDGRCRIVYRTQPQTESETK